MNVQKMRYTKGLHIDITSYAKADKKILEYKHANIAKKKGYKQLISQNNNKAIVIDDSIQMSTFSITTNIQNLQRKENKSSQVLTTNFVTTPIASQKQKMLPKVAKASDASLQNLSHKTERNFYSEGDLSRSKIMLIALSTNLLAVIGLVALTTIIGGTNIIGFIIAGICAAFGVAFAKYGYEEAQNDTFGFLILYALVSLPGFLVNSIILIILGVYFV